MGKATDMTGLQFRMLNTKKGPSVWAPRAQCDKKAYQFRLWWIRERQANLDVKQGQTASLLHKDGEVCGVATTLDVQYHGKTVVVTTGTFLRGLMHIGSNQQSGGRAGESAAMGLSNSLKEIGLELGRLKTGTPPRLNRRSIDFSKMEVQPGDEPVPYFTYWKDDLFHVEHSGVNPLDIGHSGGSIRPAPSSTASTANFPATSLSQLRRQPKSSAPISTNPHVFGVIEGVGPRYCPSIEDKIVKFPKRSASNLPRTGRHRHRRILRQRLLHLPPLRGAGRNGKDHHRLRKRRDSPAYAVE